MTTETWAQHQTHLRSAVWVFFIFYFPVFTLLPNAATSLHSCVLLVDTCTTQRGGSRGTSMLGGYDSAQRMPDRGVFSPVDTSTSHQGSGSNQQLEKVEKQAGDANIVVRKQSKSRSCNSLLWVFLIKPLFLRFGVPRQPQAKEKRSSSSWLSRILVWFWWILNNFIQ